MERHQVARAPGMSHCPAEMSNILEVDHGILLSLAYAWATAGVYWLGAAIRAMMCWAGRKRQGELAWTGRLRSASHPIPSRPMDVLRQPPHLQTTSLFRRWVSQCTEAGFWKQQTRQLCSSNAATEQSAPLQHASVVLADAESRMLAHHSQIKVLWVSRKAASSEHNFFP